MFAGDSWVSLTNPICLSVMTKPINCWFVCWSSKKLGKGVGMFDTAVLRLGIIPLSTPQTEHINSFRFIKDRLLWVNQQFSFKTNFTTCAIMIPRRNPFEPSRLSLFPGNSYCFIIISWSWNEKINSNSWNSIWWAGSKQRLRQENSLSFTTKLLWLLQRFCQTWIFTRVFHSEGNFKLCKLHRIYYYDPKD